MSESSEREQKADYEAGWLACPKHFHEATGQATQIQQLQAQLALAQADSQHWLDGFREVVFSLATAEDRIKELEEQLAVAERAMEKSRIAEMSERSEQAKRLAAAEERAHLLVGQARELRAMLDEALSQEDLDSDEYGMRCHWCHVATEDSPEWLAYQAAIQAGIAESERQQGKITNFIARAARLSQVSENIGPFQGDYTVLNHKDDCLYIKYQQFVKEQNADT